MTGKEKIMELWVAYTRDTGEHFDDNIPKYADWLEKKLCKLTNMSRIVMTDKDHRTESIRGLLVKMKKDLQRYSETDKATPRIIQAKEFVINEIEKYVDHTENWIMQLEDDNMVNNIHAQRSIDELKNQIFLLEAICLIHGITDFPVWAAKGSNYLLDTVMELQRENSATLPAKFRDSHLFRSQYRWK